MFLFYLSAGTLLGAVWLWKAIEVSVGLPKVDDIAQPQWSADPARLASLSIVVPAKNEAEQIRACLDSLLSLDYPKFELIAVDDRSSDDTGKIMDEMSADQRIKVIHVTELPPRWLGKTHAMWRGAAVASGEWILFTDGDVV